MVSRTGLDFTDGTLFLGMMVPGVGTRGITVAGGEPRGIMVAGVATRGIGVEGILFLE